MLKASGMTVTPQQQVVHQVITYDLETREERFSQGLKYIKEHYTEDSCSELMRILLNMANNRGDQDAVKQLLALSSELVTPVAAMSITSAVVDGASLESGSSRDARVSSGSSTDIATDEVKPAQYIHPLKDARDLEVTTAVAVVSVDPTSP